MSDEEIEEAEHFEETESDGLISFLSVIACGLLISALIGLMSIIFYPSIRPREMENMLDPVDQIVFDCQEFAYNSFCELMTVSPQWEPSKFDLALAEQSFKEEADEMDKEIKGLRSQIPLIPFQITRKSDYIEAKILQELPKQSAVSLLSDIESLIQTIAQKEREYNRIQQLNVYIQGTKKTKKKVTERAVSVVSAVAHDSATTANQAPVTKPESSTQKAEDLVHFKLAIPRSKSLLLITQKRTNLVALYTAKCNQLKWLLKINEPKSVYQRLWNAFNVLFELQQGKGATGECSENESSIVMKRLNFIAAAQNTASRFLNKIRQSNY